jgi:squalene-hopene/tetraprenyl-beta-curcumene cyclase
MTVAELRSQPQDSESPSALDADGPEALRRALNAATTALLRDQAEDGHWCYELEADVTIPAEYILLMHFMDEIDRALELRLAAYIRRIQNPEGGWSLYTGGRSDLSATVKAYYALKLAGDDPDDAHMRRARDLVIERGGAARCNVFTRIALAMFAQVPWRAVPFIPVEVMLLPRWFPFHITKVSYWSRTVMVPLFVLTSLKARAVNPRGIGIPELFVVPPWEEPHYFIPRSTLNRFFFFLDRIGRGLEHLIPDFVRRRALRRALLWFTERLNGVDGLGAIFPAMVNAYEALRLLGYPADHPLCLEAREAIRRLVVERADEAYCQPCVSPIWDTALAVLALEELADPPAEPIERALQWLASRQVNDLRGDWAVERPHLEPGGWAFQYGNAYYPDLDDTSMVAWAFQRWIPSRSRYAHALDRATRWLVGMQSANGGFASFDADNTHYYLNEIPFADHGALLDPPTVDVSAHVYGYLGSLENPPAWVKESMRRCRDYMLADQESHGGWYGRWGTNYIYGTFSVLLALQVAGEDMHSEPVRRAVRWLESLQRDDGSWGETNDSYENPSLAGRAERGTAFQTAWAVLALIAAGRAGTAAVRRGVAYLLRTQRADGTWKDPEFTAPGFPRVFYLKYHGYTLYFPLWALAAYARSGGLRAGTVEPRVAPPHGSFLAS